MSEAKYFVAGFSMAFLLAMGTKHVCCHNTTIGKFIRSFATFGRCKSKKLEPIVSLPTMPVKYHKIVGIYGGLGPKASSTFMDEGLVDGRVALFNAMQAGTSQTDRLEQVSKVSTADWTVSEVQRVHEQSMGRTKLVDQDHIPVIMMVNGTTPGRPQYILGESPTDPVPQMAYTCQSLLNAGATTLAMVCNTAHYFRFQVEEVLAAHNEAGSVPEFLDMLELTLKYVARKSVQPNEGEGKRINGKPEVVVGLLATRATLETKLFEDVAKRLNDTPASKVFLRIVTPLSEEGKDPSACQANVEEAIFGEKGIKTGYHELHESDDAKNNLKLLLEQACCLVNAGASAIVMGCTELPLVLTEETVAKYGHELLSDARHATSLSKLLLVNPTKILADEVIHYSLLSRET